MSKPISPQRPWTWTELATGQWNIWVTQSLFTATLHGKPVHVYENTTDYTSASPLLWKTLTPTVWNLEFCSKNCVVKSWNSCALHCDSSLINRGEKKERRRSLIGTGANYRTCCLSVIINLSFLKAYIHLFTTKQKIGLWDLRSFGKLQLFARHEYT